LPRSYPATFEDILVDALKTITITANIPNIDVKLSEAVGSISGGKTLADIHDRLGSISGSVQVTNFPSDYPDSVAHSWLGSIHDRLHDVKGTVNTPDVLPVKEVEQLLSNYSLAAGGVVDRDLGPITDRTAAIITVRGSFDPSATAGFRLYWLYSPDGSNYDDEVSAEAEGNYTDIGYDSGGAFVGAGSIMQKTVIAPFVTPYMRLRVKNLDGSYAGSLDLWRTLMR